MKKVSFFLLVLALGLSLPAHADKSTKIIRGGMGFLFPDNNSFQNPGQFPLSYGMAFETSYSRLNGSSAQALTPSFVYGNGRLGLGAYYSRAGTDLSTSATNAVGTGVGVSFLKDKLTFGASYSRSLDTLRTSDGSLGFTANLNGPQRMGPSIGIGAETTINATGGDRQNAKVGVGYSFRSNQSIEGGLAFNDLRDTSDFSPYFAATFGSQFVYFGGAYSYAKLAEEHTAGGRLGVILGRYIDVSAQAAYVLKTGGAASYAATVRASF